MNKELSTPRSEAVLPPWYRSDSFGRDREVYPLQANGIENVHIIQVACTYRMQYVICLVGSSQSIALPICYPCSVFASPFVTADNENLETYLVIIRWRRIGAPGDTQHSD